MRNFLDKYQGKKNFPCSPTLLYFLFFPSSWGCLSQPYTLRNPPAWPEMKWWKLPQFKLIHTSHLWHDWFSFSALKYGIVFFLFSLWKQLMYTALACQRRGSSWHVEEHLKWIRMKFESAIFHLSITFQRDPLTTNRETLSKGVPICSTPCNGPLASLIKILAADKSFAQVHCTDPECFRDILLRFSRCYW